MGKEHSISLIKRYKNQYDSNCMCPKSEQSLKAKLLLKHVFYTAIDFFNNLLH